MPDSFAFQSDNLTIQDAFDRYRDLYSGGSTVERADGAFHADVKAIRFPRLLMFERRLSGVTHQRDAQRVARDGFNHVTLQVVLAGAMLVVTDGVEQCVGAGDIVVFDNTRPQLTSTPGAHLLSFSIARDAVAPFIRNETIPHGLVLDRPTGAELISHVRGLSVRAACLSGENADREALIVGRLLGETLIAVHNLVGQSNSALLSGIRNYTRIMAYLDRHAGNPKLSVAEIAQGTGMSRSALYRLFEPVGGVADFVLQQRLLHLRRTLSSRPDRTIGALALDAGFASANHAVRRFRSEFGMTPQTFRNDMMRTRTAIGPAHGRAKIPPAWFDELL